MKYLVVSVFLAIIVGGGLIAFYVNNELKETALKSCLLSLYDPLVDILRSDEKIVGAGEEKIILLSELKLQLLKSDKTDCGRIENMGAGNDEWGNNVKILVRKLNNGEVEVQLSSAGPDGVEKSNDDIVIQTKKSP